MKVLVACEFSAIVRDAFLERGHIAISCDLLDSEGGDPHYKGNVLDILNGGWDLLIAHPPCTYLCNSGVHHLHKQDDGDPRVALGATRWQEMEKGAQLFNALKDAPIRFKAIENPIPHKYARALIGDYSQIIHPWQHGHGESKATCLWLTNLPELKPTKIVTGRHPSVFLVSPGPNRGLDRSRTYMGIANAMAEQWGSFVKKKLGDC